MQPEDDKSARVKTVSNPASDDPDPAPEAETGLSEHPRPREIGGRDGPDPTRYGDWEKNGRCIDF
ncbi:MAG: DUF1674 domain-containing protein [Gammaproteobacteria bacterium]|jgi:hypothetical protein